MLEFSPAEGRLAASSSPSHHAVHQGLIVTLSACQEGPPVEGPPVEEPLVQEPPIAVT